MGQKTKEGERRSRERPRDAERNRDKREREAKRSAESGLAYIEMKTSGKAGRDGRVHGKENEGDTQRWGEDEWARAGDGLGDSRSKRKEGAKSERRQEEASWI